MIVFYYGGFMSVLETKDDLLFLENFDIVYTRTKNNLGNCLYVHNVGYCKVLHPRVLKLDAVKTAAEGLESHLLVLGETTDVIFEPEIIQMVSGLDFVSVLKKEVVGKKFGQVVVHLQNMADWACLNVSVNSADNAVLKCSSEFLKYDIELDANRFGFLRFRF
jgi:hypothetical protein